MEGFVYLNNVYTVIVINFDGGAKFFVISNEEKFELVNLGILIFGKCFFKFIVFADSLDELTGC